MAKTLVTYLFLFATVLASAQTIKLNFQPTQAVIRFYYDSLTIFTDTTSLFYVYQQYGTEGLEGYDLRVKHLVIKQFNETKSDTISFAGTFIPFNDGIERQNQNEWYVEWAILHLLKSKKVLMHDKHERLVRTIITKKVGSKKKGRVKMVYANKDTGEELFDEVLFVRITHPAF